MLAGNAIAPAGRALPAVNPGEDPSDPDLPRPRRNVLLHYHLFKNAGTSVDAILQSSFGKDWLEREFAPAPPNIQTAHLRAILQDPEIVAVSSHTLLFPLPQVPGIDFFPLVFVRQPLIRLRSAYAFERRQNADTPGARLAKLTSFGEYLERRLANPADRACRDFQSYRLALYIPSDLGPERARALATLDLLPFVGLVERFDHSIAVLQRRVAPLFPRFNGFSTHKNVTTRHADETTMLADIRRDLGPSLYNTVAEANLGDLACYEKVKRLNS
jgi:hypothetical protein